LHGHSELDPDEVDPVLLDYLRSSGIPIDTWYTWTKYGRYMRGYRDVILAESAAEIFKTHKPELMAVHFLVTDTKQHGWGPNHYMAHAALTRADHNVGILRQAVRDAGLEDRTTFVIVSDHGFSSVTHEVNIYPVWKAAGLDGVVKLHVDRWNVFVETTDAFDRERDEKKLQAFSKMCCNWKVYSASLLMKSSMRLDIPAMKKILMWPDNT
jgi:predicted AlkP superfamily pyrophosphatase or phosphodiesterase